MLPWRGERHGTARMFCDILTPDGEPSLADSRNVLKRALARASDKGFTFYTHPEVEFYLFNQPADAGSPLVPVDQGGYFDHLARGSTHDFRRAAITMLESMGISVEFSHHEAGPGQNEIDLRYADALTTADNLMTFRTVVKEVALEQGVFASFMPKPMADHPGSGMHTHLSLFEGDRNAFHEPGAQFELSKTARQFIAGLLVHAAEITAITNQYVNSYKRLWGGAEAPSYVCWGHNNRSALVRVPMYKPGKGNRAAWSTARSTRRPTRTWRSPSCWPPGSRASRRATSSRGDRGRRLGAHRRGASCARHQAAPAVARRGDPHHGGLRARRRDAGRARVRLRAAQQAPGVGRVPRAGHPVRAEAVPPGPVSGSTTTSGRSGGSRRPTLTGRLARFGFADITRSAGLLADPDLALLLDPGAPPDDDGPEAGAADPAGVVDDELLAAFGQAADPDLALLQVVRLAGALRPDVEARGALADLARGTLRPGPARDRLLAVLGASVALGDDVVRRPALLEVVADPAPGTGVAAGDVRAELLRAVGADPTPPSRSRPSRGPSGSTRCVAPTASGSCASRRRTSP